MDANGNAFGSRPYEPRFGVKRVTSPSSRTRSSSKSRFARTTIPGNQLLARLPGVVRDGIKPHLQRVRLARDQTIFHAHEPLQAAYFPESGVVSLLTHLMGGDTLDVGLVGKDGMTGIALIPGVNMMPYDGTVLVAGTALRMDADTLKRAARQFEPLHYLLGRYAYSLFAQGVQTAACNSFHPIRQRCARWLLMLHDLADGDDFPVTQHLLAVMLGVRRPSVTLVARDLQRAGFVDYRHGHVKIRNRRGLEAASCECYRLVRDEQQRLIGY